jgi:hypothetical protein
MKAFCPANSHQKGYFHYAFLMPESMKRMPHRTGITKR